MFLGVDSIVKDYPSGDSTLRVLKGVSLEIEEGEIVSIVGPSGSGKSTLLHIMGFLDRPTSGEAVFRDKPLSSMNGAAQVMVRNSGFGFVFQHYHLLPELNAFENTILPLMIRHTVGGWLGARGRSRKRTSELLADLGLGERMHHFPHQLSGGECQRVAIARALIGDPDVVFCDEPTGNLDAATAREIQDLIVRLSRETGKTFVIVTHDKTVASLARRILHLVDGRIVSG